MHTMVYECAWLGSCVEVGVSDTGMEWACIFETIGERGTA